MATYGFVPPGGLTFTGQTNTLGVGPANAEATAGQVYFNGLTQGDHRIAMMLRNGGMSIILRRLMVVLNGAAAGANATVTKKQVAGVVGGTGGAMPVETVTLINRATTAADVTALTGLFNRLQYPASYPADLSGNGGGGKSAVAGGGIY